MEAGAAPVSASLRRPEARPAPSSEESQDFETCVVPLEGRQGRAVGELIRLELKNLLAAAHVRGVNVSATGVSVPGISYSRTGKVWAPNIPGWEDYPLRRELQA